MHRYEKGHPAYNGPTPTKVCDGCGEEKSVEYFGKLYGVYKKRKALDPRRYDNQCKKCRKPLRPGQVREELPEVKTRRRGRQRAAQKKTWTAKRKAARKERTKETNRKYKQRIREETRVQSMTYLAEKGCEECGERDPRKLEYDHKKTDDKRRNISDLITDGYSWTAPVLSGEVAKCRVICSNCHRVHTIRQQGYYAFKSVQETLGRLSARYKFDL